MATSTIVTLTAQISLIAQGRAQPSLAAAPTVKASFASPATPGSSTQPSTPATDHSTLSGGQTVLAVAIIALAMLAAGFVVIRARDQQKARHATLGNSYIRAWVAIALVMGLLIFCALSFGIDDPTLRNALMGGLTASVGAAIAFYFSSSSSAQARQDLLTATGKTDPLPNLVGKTRDKAITELGSRSFKFEIDQTGNTSPAPDGKIDKTTPDAGAMAAVGSTIQAHFA